MTSLAGLPPVVSLEEAARFLRLTTGTTRRRLAAGDIIGWKEGSAGWRTTPQALADYIQARTRTTTPAGPPGPPGHRTAQATAPRSPRARAMRARRNTRSKEQP
ncbi:hypothetical protein [Actinomyces sp. HMT897]|uniref:hypothetical protein n=1 Tax=Actinomyces sp. HMT897 TaxID=2789424 RepID=UPI00190A3445|nr:hypothetical protein [Actinomyces sp. HMT897]QQO78144.1 hypothetical protein JJJ15_01910 [Actinomyces sp. HMT897]